MAEIEGAARHKFGGTVELPEGLEVLMGRPACQCKTCVAADFNGYVLACSCSKEGVEMLVSFDKDHRQLELVCSRCDGVVTRIAVGYAKQ